MQHKIKIKTKNIETSTEFHNALERIDNDKVIGEVIK